jgi:F-type H+/Na+-transporting ATPase subunit alpha
LSVAMLAVSLYAAEKGYLDDLPIAQILPFEKSLHTHFANNYADWVKAANDKSDWNNDIEATLKKGIEEFKKTGSW